MKYLVPTTAFASLFFSASILASSLEIPLNFEYLALDGQEISTTSFKHQAELDLTPGTHKIAIRFHDMMQDQYSDSQTFVKSSPFIITLDVQDNTEYQLAPASDLALKDPKKYAETPKVNINSNNNSPVSFQYVLTQYEEPSFFNRLFTGSQTAKIDASTAAATAVGTSAMVQANTQTTTNQANSADAIVIATGAAQTASGVVTAPATAVNDGANPEQMLQYWWLQADDNTRKEFMSWAIKQL
ncbi:MAG: DUF2057 domain-containing protein [Shewanella sp.]